MTGLLRALGLVALLGVFASGAAEPRAVPLPARGARLQGGAIRKAMHFTTWQAVASDAGVQLTTTRWSRGGGTLGANFNLATLPTASDVGQWKLESQEVAVLPALECEGNVAQVFHGKFALATVPVKDAPEMAEYRGAGKSKRTRLYTCPPRDGGWEEALLAPEPGVVELSFSDDMTNGDVFWVLPSAR